MPYKALVLMLTCCWLSSEQVHGQLNGSSKANNRLQVEVHNQIEMQLNRKVAQVVFNKKKDSMPSTNGLVQNQFVVVSNAPYSISVAATTPYLINGADRIPMSSVSMSVWGAGKQNWHQSINALSTQPQTLSRMAPSTLSQAYSIMYRVRPLRPVIHATAGIYQASLLFTTTQE